MKHPGARRKGNRSAAVEILFILATFSEDYRAVVVVALFVVCCAVAHQITPVYYNDPSGNPTWAHHQVFVVFDLRRAERDEWWVDGWNNEETAGK